MELLFVIHLFTSFVMTGICWFVQIVHYPLFRVIEEENLPQYEIKNVVTAYITVPTMIVEMCTGIALLYFDYNEFYLWNVILLGLIALSTCIFQVPIHLRLMKVNSERLVNLLIYSNWIRTLSWTVRSALLIIIILGKL